MITFGRIQPLSLSIKTDSYCLLHSI